VSNEPIPEPLEHPAQPEQPKDGFAEGEASPEVFPEEETVGRFSEGEELLPDTPEKHHITAASARARRSFPRRTPRSTSSGASARGRTTSPPA
jgi:hypothetical protein